MRIARRRRRRTRCSTAAAGRRPSPSPARRGGERTRTRWHWRDPCPVEPRRRLHHSPAGARAAPATRSVRAARTAPARAASRGEAPASVAARKPPAKASPAPVESTTRVDRCHGDGLDVAVGAVQQDRAGPVLDDQEAGPHSTTRGASTALANTTPGRGRRARRRTAPPRTARRRRPTTRRRSPGHRPAGCGGPPRASPCRSARRTASRPAHAPT